MQDVLRLDLETYSDTDLRVHGLDRYVSDPSFEIMMCAYALNDGAVRLWVVSEDGPMPPRLRAAIQNRRIIKKAWNAQFERVALAHGLDLRTDYDEWRCSMVRAGMLALPMKLDECGRVMKLGAAFQKDSEGQRLIRLFCVPHAPTKKHPYTRYTKDTHPQDWAKFKAYCIRDVVSERKIDTLLERFPVPELQWKIYALDQKINDRGIPIDMVFVRNAISMMTRRKAEIAKELSKLTGLKNGNSTTQLLPWLRARGYPFDNLTKERVAKALSDFKDNMTAQAVTACKLRQVAAKTSVNKFKAMEKRVGTDGRLRYWAQMAGAGRTNRWAGRGVQVQNMTRPAKAFKKHLADIRQVVRDNDYEWLKMCYGDPILVLSSSVRSAIAAPEGKELRVADLSAIETRLTGYVAGCEFLNSIFKRKEDPYLFFAAKLYGKRPIQVTPEERQDNKPVVLGGGYGLSPGTEVGKYPDIVKTGLMGYAEAMGVKLTKDQARAQIMFYRDLCHEVKSLWAELEEGAMRAITERKTIKVSCVEFDVISPFLRMKLPSGRYIYYLRPQIRDNVIKHPGGEFVKRGISYEGRNKVGAWTRVTTHGGKYVEQFAQGTGYDILAFDLLAMDAKGFDLVMHVHDEGVSEEDIEDSVHTLPVMLDEMRITPNYLDGLLLDAAGYVSPYYKKD